MRRHGVQFSGDLVSRFSFHFAIQVPQVFLQYCLAFMYLKYTSAKTATITDSRPLKLNLVTGRDLIAKLIPTIPDMIIIL